MQVHQIANCLETGVFEALEKQYLRAVVIAFQHGSTADAPLLEAYTLKFHYSSEGEVSMILEDLEEDSAQKKSSHHRAEAVVRCDLDQACGCHTHFNVICAGLYERNQVTSFSDATKCHHNGAHATAFA